MPRLPLVLMQELIEEILLRFPSDEPKFLFRATLVCKAWCRLITGARFCRRFREHHRGTAPVLGLFCRIGSCSPTSDLWIKRTKFTPTSSFRSPSARNISSWRAIDSLHGRNLFWDKEESLWPLGSSACLQFLVWSPIAGEVRRLPKQLGLNRFRWSAVLLCAVAGCHHLDCGGAFAVVLACTNSFEGFTYVYVYSSEKHVWSEPVSIQDRSLCVTRGPSAHVGKTVYFLCEHEGTSKLLAYQLCKQEISFVSLPSMSVDLKVIALTAADEGELGLAMARDAKLFITWSRKGGDTGWTQQRVLELRQDIPIFGPLVPASAV